MAENQGPLLLLWVTVALAVLSPERVRAEWKRNGSMSVYPREYLVPTSPPLPPLTLRCSYILLIENSWILETMDIGDGECCPHNCQGSKKDECYLFGKSGVAPAGSITVQLNGYIPESRKARLLNLREDVGAMFIEGMWSPPLLEELETPWFCAIYAYATLRLNRVFQTEVDAVIPAESGNVSMTILPDQSLFAALDHIQVQCVGVVGIKQATLHGHLVLQRYSHTASDWIVIDTATARTRVEFPNAVLGTRIQETVGVTLLVSDILEVAGSCQLTFRCFLNYPNYKTYLDRAQTRIVRVSPGSGGCVGNETPPPARITTPAMPTTTTQKADRKSKAADNSVRSSDSDNLFWVLAASGGVLFLAAFVIGLVFCQKNQKRRRRGPGNPFARGRSQSRASRFSQQFIVASPSQSQRASQQFQQFQPVIYMQEPMSQSMSSMTDASSEYSEASSSHR